MDISRGKLLDPDIKLVPDISAGHSRHASSTLAGSASQRSIKTIHTRGISESMAGDKMPLHPPLLHELRRREQARLIEIENMKIAHKLMSVSGDPALKQRNLAEKYKSHQHAKAVLCKLPIIDMANNQFAQGLDVSSRGALQRGRYDGTSSPGWMSKSQSKQNLASRSSNRRLNSKRSRA